MIQDIINKELLNLKEKLIALNNVVSVFIDKHYKDEYHLNIRVVVNKMEDAQIIDSINDLVQDCETQVRKINNKWCMDIELMYH